MNITLYELLGVPATATEDTIRQALTQKQRFWGKRASNAPSRDARHEAEQKMSELSEARRVLLDPQARAAYDAGLGGGAGRQPGPPPAPPQPGPVPPIWPQPSQPPPAARPAAAPGSRSAWIVTSGRLMPIVLVVWGAGLIIGYGLLKSGSSYRSGNIVFGIIFLAVGLILLLRRRRRR